MFALVYYPILSRLEPESIRVLLSRYDAYCREINAHAAQVASEDSTTGEPGWPVGLVFCVEADQLESAVENGMIPGCKSVKTFTDAPLQSFLDAETQESQTTITESDLIIAVGTALKMDMSVKLARSGIMLLLMGYK